MARKQSDSTSTELDTDVTQKDVGTGGRRSFNIAGWKLRNKIILALAFPMIAATWFAVDQATEANADRVAHEATAGQLEVLEAAVDFLSASEKAAVVARQRGNTNNPAVQSAITEVEDAAQRLDGLSSDDSLSRNQQAQVSNLVALVDEASSAAAYSSPLQSVSHVRGLHNGVVDFLKSMTTEQSTSAPVLEQIADVMEGRLAFTMQQLQVEFASDSETITNQPQLYTALGAEDSALSALWRGRQDHPTLATLRSLNASRVQFVTRGEGNMPFEETFSAYDDMHRVVLGEAESQLQSDAQEARDLAIRVVAILAISLIATLVLAGLIGRTIVRPVRRVRDGAIAVASEELPRAVAQIRAGEEPDPVIPIPVHTQEEMGQLARAVDELHRTAVDLAAGEAELRSQVGEMFVTLSRRNTSLINQQLGLIEELEHDEQDPRRLESLFKLDHLAARMRRTAESLVILSDAPVRQRDGQSLAITDALQAATAGVQDYQRIELRGSSSDEVVGASANDVVHLLTELMDNALSFSPPHAPVQVSTTSASGQVIITIADAGLGIPSDVLAQLNEMLHTDVGITPDAARRMGLFVVGRLAHRHGIDVRLTQNEAGGITATVVLPGSLLAGGAAAPFELPVDDTPEVTPPTLVPSAEPQTPSVFAPPAPVPPAPSVPSVPPVPSAFPEPTPVASTVAEPDTAADTGLDAPAINPLTGLPQRRPGATVSDREAAVNPTGGGLFAAPPEQDASGLFDRAEPEPELETESQADDSQTDFAGFEAQFGESVEEKVDDTHDAHAAADEPVDDLFAPLTPTPPAFAPRVVDPLNDPLSDVFASERHDEPVEETPAEELPEPAAEVEVEVEDEVEDEPTPTLTPLPTRSASTHEEPVTPMTSEASASISMFGSAPRDEEALARSQDREIDPAISARVGLFGAFSKGRTPRPAEDGQNGSPAAAAPQSGSPVDAVAAAVAGSSMRDTPSVLDEPSVLDRAAERKPEPEPTPAPVPEPVTVPATSPEPTREVAQNNVTPIGSKWLGDEAPGSWAKQEVDQGWAAAQKVAETKKAETTPAGLPKRQPGQRLVPGGISPTAGQPPRDPAAVRRRLAAHAAGVSRGRSASVQPSKNKKEEGQ